ncbi:MAG TPA: hypothetical protein VLD58_08560, partial [Gemmatimonadales bacterium]|nr:hypothetical protein [Gemmatimonadales bacterium]
FNHGKLGFPLAGAHSSAACRACHQSLDFKGTTRTCASCHTDVHRGELGADCAKCHTPRSFLDRSTMTRAHQLTRFPLEGAHLAADCTSCHAPAAQGGQQFVARQTTCVSCHQADFASAKDPDHSAGGFPRECASCHAVTVWSRARFDHSASRFALTGAHRAVTCSQCHVNNQFTGTRTDCVGCHQNDYNGAAQPSHTQAQLPTDCVLCHSTTSWNANYDHSRTQFPLTGAHRAVNCMDCHSDNVYRGKPTDCVSCHLPDYNGAADPNHKTAQFPTTCVPCHSTTAWQPASFDHNASSFPLTGSHKAVACADCHSDGVYNGKPTTCQSCHLGDFNRATSPNHAQLGWPQTCITCHAGSTNTVAWDSGVTLPSQYHTMFSVNHEGARGDCTQCHLTTNYSQSTCSTHHHPPSCTYLNRSTCGG